MELSAQELVRQSPAFPPGLLGRPRLVNLAELVDGFPV